MQIDLRNTVALVTGASQGIGKAIAEKLAASGSAVAIAALPDEALERTTSEFNAKGYNCRSYAADLADDAQLHKLAGSVLRDFGHIDVLVNNAGITGPTGAAHEIAVEDWDRTLRLDLRAPFMLSRSFIPSMIARKTGRIINMSSIAGKMAYPLRSPYASAKWGLIGLTVTLAQELGPHGILVNAICPGPTRTEMIESVIRARATATGTDFETMSQEYVKSTAIKRMMLPEEVADLVLFLCSPASTAITGQAIEISGGYGFRIG